LILDDEKLIRPDANDESSVEYVYNNEKEISFFGMVKALKEKMIDELTEAKARKAKSKLRKVDTITSTITMGVLVIYVIEFGRFQVSDMVSTSFNHVLRSIMLIANGFQCWVLYYHYIYTLEMMKILKQKHPKETLKSSGMLRGYIIECIISMIICPPFVDTKFSLAQMKGFITLSIDGICFSVCLLKSYSLLRLPEQYIKWTDETSSRICKKHKCKADIMFLIKCEFNRRPYFLVIVSFFIIAALCGYGMRTYEATYFTLDLDGQISGGNSYFELIINCFWFMVVTMMTVGFGDGFPVTHIGRIIALVGCIIGTMIVSLMLVALSNTAALSIAETRVFTEVDRRERMDHITTKSAIFLLYIFEVYILNKEILEEQETLEVETPESSEKEKDHTGSHDKSQANENGDAEEVFSNNLKEDEKGPQMIISPKFRELLFKRFGLFSISNSMAQEISYDFKRFEMLSSTAEDTVLKLNEGGINRTRKVFEVFKNAKRVSELCGQIIAHQRSINDSMDHVITHQNCLRSFITNLNDFFREELEAEAEGA
jgi:Ion channel